jgi:NNP family nitrate/nitrite transporter-like MFS transporter
MNKGFLKAGHLPTLVAAFLYFDLSFMVWVLLGPLGVQIAKTLHLSPAEKGLMVATPVLAAAALRFLNGILVDRFKPKRVGIAAQVFVIAGLLAAWHFGLHSLGQVRLFGIVLGMAGASFAIALPLASRWYPPEHQGTALGIAGAGNSGTVLAALFAPSLAVAFGWNNVFGLVAIPMAIVLVVYLVLAKDSPHCPPAQPMSSYFKVLGIGDAWWFMLFYSVTFGGFVGLTSSLTIYFNDLFALPPVHAGYCTAACVFAGSLVRPLGGALADRIGGVRTLTGVYALAAALLGLVSFGLPSLWLALVAFIAIMATLGVGNGAVFQLVPQRFRHEIGVMTGLVGMAGGLGGFYLASSLGYSKQLTGSYQAGFLLFALLALIALAGISGVKRRWRTTWTNLAGMPASVRI